MQKTLTEKQRFAVERCERMAKEIMRKKFGDNLLLVMARLSRIYALAHIKVGHFGFF
jgi:hypothetical protein